MADHPSYTPRQAFARDVLTAAVDGGSSYWARIWTYRSDCPPDHVLAVGVDTEDDQSVFQVSLADIQAAIDNVADRADTCGFGRLDHL
jgi:hypothetical protein